MKVTMRLTLDGLVRAMRAKAHAEAGAVESGTYREALERFEMRRRANMRSKARRGSDNDRSGD
ncbi:hypothetical protein [Chelativorans sp. Marseille-P2723]|uniref:hypothetical protein n=1 Tax=Chelativorans sp. Marseille-P2723 TaxID=2709133 RepID=UPI00156FAEED|nr:hypothetical protein [Chelativorans sp. Marseille-P2723]